ncbi:MAG TPA: DUF1648 domain-containing protein [Methanospirillum sp.]|nr:DUF1648 domain-containing protein [Methanospirillum sp.]
MRPALIVSILIILVTLAWGVYLMPSLPDQLPSHWNVNGDVDGYMPKIPGLLFLPALSLLILGLMVFLPRYDPLYEQYHDFQPAYEGLILLVVLFLSALYIVTLLWAIGIQIEMNILMSILFGLLYGGIGFFFRSVKKTWFVGIRTPWTMSSDQVWKETHQAGVYVFAIAGLFCLGGVIIPDMAYLFIMVPMLIGVCGLVFYSYLRYKKENRS